MQNQIPKNWQKVKLGDIAVVNMGQSPSSAFYNAQGEGLPFYQGVTDFGEKYPTPSMYCSQPAKTAEPGTALFSVRAPVGEVNIANEETCIGRGVASISMINGNNDFLYFSLKNQEGYFKAISGGTTYESINKDQIEDVEVVVPNDSEDQKKVAAILSAFDDKIELNNKIAKTLEEMAQVLFKEWFVNFRFPGYEKAKFVDSELGEIPKGWSLEKLGTFFDLKGGLSYKAEFLTSNKKGGLPLITMGCVSQQVRLNFDELKYYKGSYGEKNLLKPGDIAVATRDVTQERTILGSPVIIPSTLEKSILATNMYLIVNKSPLPQLFLYHLLKTQQFRGRILGSAKGSNILMLTKDSMLGFEFILPPQELVDRFDSLASAVAEKLEKLTLEIQKLAALRDLLLPKLMKGEIRI